MASKPQFDNAMWLLWFLFGIVALGASAAMFKVWLFRDNVERHYVVKD